MTDFDLESHILCSVCWEDVSGDCGRTVVALQCSHLFHLDCIGSSFNASGCMRCPNCRQVENGNWWGFKNDEPEINIDDIGYYVDVVDEGIHTSSEMEPVYDHSSRTASLMSELYLVSDQVISEEPVRFSSEPNVNSYMIDPHLPNNVAASHVIQDHHHLMSIPHQSILNPWQTSVSAARWYTPRTDPVSSMLQQDIVSHQAILDTMFSTQSAFWPSGGSISFGNGALIYNNFTRTLSSNISPLPVVQDMEAEINTTNGVNSGSQAGNAAPVPQETARFNHIYSSTASPQSDNGLYNTSSPGCFCCYMNPFI